ncbi:MAG: transposase [Phenylobacterium sp.]|nr:transposase [Phenylobacterium sp.]
MEIAADALPEDLEALRAMALGLQQKLAQSDQITADLVVERDALASDNARLAELNTRLEHFLARLRRLSFGKSSERMDPDQLQLALEDTGPWKISDGGDLALRSWPLGWARPLPKRRPPRTGHQHRRAGDAPHRPQSKERPLRGRR